MGSEARQRCAWASADNQLYLDYHDTEWGRFADDDRLHFEMLILEGAQAGLSWLTILQKRAGYRRLFHDFVPEKVAAMSDAELEQCLQDPGIVRNRAKVYSARSNAQIYLQILQQHGSFINFVEQAIGFRHRTNGFATMAELPAQTPESVEISAQLRRMGMKFVGPTIIYAYMQATGIVNDHLTSCWYRPACCLR